MPYGMPDPSMDAKVERCVEQVMATGKDKVSAIRICKAAILKAARSGR